jgi:hypothetical protein
MGIVPFIQCHGCRLWRGFALGGIGGWILGRLLGRLC